MSYEGGERNKQKDESHVVSEEKVAEKGSDEAVRGRETKESDEGVGIRERKDKSDHVSEEKVAEKGSDGSVRRTETKESGQSE